jgi:hypothetical protein
MPVLSGIFGKAALYDFGVICMHPANSGPEMLLLFLKALISISAPILSYKTHKLSIQFFHRFLFGYFVPINSPEACY